VLIKWERHILNP